MEDPQDPNTYQICVNNIGLIQVQEQKTVLINGVTQFLGLPHYTSYGYILPW